MCAAMFLSRHRCNGSSSPDLIRRSGSVLPRIPTMRCGPPSDRAKSDYFGGAYAKQAYYLCTGPGAGEPLHAVRGGGADLLHRCTLEQMRSSNRDEAVRRGVPRQAATDFLLGHLMIELAVASNCCPGPDCPTGRCTRSLRRGRSSSGRAGWSASFRPMRCGPRCATSAIRRTAALARRHRMFRACG